MKSLVLTFLLSFSLPLFSLSCNFIFQQLHLSTWMQQSQSYQRHHPWDPRTLSGQGSHQQLRKPLLLPPVTFLKCHQRRALDTAERTHCNCKSLLDFGSVWLWCVSSPNILFGSSNIFSIGAWCVPSSRLICVPHILKSCLWICVLKKVISVGTAVFF